MCRFKSGIILKGKCVIADGDDDSHSNLLRKLKIEDTDTNARRRFVRAELLPPNEKWWTDPSTWTFHVDQDILPNWYTDDPGKYEQSFREAVTEWVKTHVKVNEEIEALSEGYYMLKDCRVEKLTDNAKVYLFDSSVNKTYHHSFVKEMHGKSIVNEMRDSSSVYEMHGKSIVNEMHDSSSVDEMHDKSSVNGMWGASSIIGMYDDSSVNKMYDYSSVNEMHDKSSVNEMWWASSIIGMYDDSSVNKMHDSSSVNGMWGDSSITGMYDDSSVNEMHDNSSVNGMWGYSSVKKIYEKAVAIDRVDDIVHTAKESGYQIQE